MPHVEDANTTRSGSGPIFLLGIMHRSGTNYLRDLFDLHPDCTILENLHEDFLVSELPSLETYAKAVCRKWNPKWRSGGADQELRRSLGQGLLAFLESKKSEACPRIVTKTPSVDNIELFYRFFPNARLVVVVRRGEDVIESGVRSFGWSYGAATDNWRRAGKNILRFCKDQKNGGESCIVVKYEDLQSSAEATLRRVFAGCGLDPEVYDFERVHNLPVKGSSAIAGGGEAVHWRPVEKDSSFKPLDRSGAWTPRMRARFSWRAGAVAEELGYASEPRFRRSAIWICYNLAADVWHFLSRCQRKAARTLTAAWAPKSP